MTSDILIIGGGVAGLSAAAALAEHGRVTVLETEEAIGFHSSGRSATMLHYALGDALVRALTLASRPFFEAPPPGFTDVPLVQRMPVLVHARSDELPALRDLKAAIDAFATLESLDEQGIAELCPLLRTSESGAVAGIADHNALRLDTDALLQGFVRAVRAQQGQIVNGARATTITRQGELWQVETERHGRFAAPVLVNAAGAWADEIATLAGVRPLGLSPTRRTIITFDAPPGTALDRLPFTKTVVDELYFAPESGRLFASPMDEVPSDPCDAQPEEFEVALAAYRIEERTIMRVERIVHRWAGLRTFAADKRPVVGFAPDARGFFWLAGQGGYGLQTSPIMARIAVALITGKEWPIAVVGANELSPARFVRQAASVDPTAADKRE